MIIHQKQIKQLQNGTLTKRNTCLDMLTVRMKLTIQTLQDKNSPNTSQDLVHLKLHY